EAEIVSWRVAVGDDVHVDQIVVEVETAKASVEVPIPFAGQVSALHARPGESVAVGAPLISVAAASESGNVLIGYGTRPGKSRRKRSTSAVTAAPPDRVAVVSPLVRRVARESGVDLRAVSGSGPNGLIMRRDVEQVRAVDPDVQRIPLTGIRKAMADKLSRSR